MFGPGRRCLAGDLEFFDVELAVAVGADVFDLRTAQLQHISPGTGFNRHAKAAETGAAAVALVPNGQVEKPERELKPYACKECVEQIEAEFAHRQMEELGVWREEEIQKPQRQGGAESGAGELQQQETPIPQMML